jgi:Tfp pilus assembly protein PilZ
MRKFVRHPSDIPIHISSRSGGENASHLHNLSLGGICCEVEHYIERGTEIVIRIPVINSSYEGYGIVVWCMPKNNHYELGVRFAGEEEAFKSRMVEQVCQIEHYKNQVKSTEGRELDGEQAAIEWISKYAAGFADQID